ncbi:DUF4148 domain-containing protein [Paraburkholderia panacisoli]|uniref:DUF4148 domain-containing protein n=1 Tax=Paraburkholderia panacisoli TaxID=2603818 RepID=A0A5B0G4G9_9BURK|nr:DUF4148 domain-containing protein [Paraburkholderia panacisoli]KAA0998276.1 DUF4148 domain-containing protein [Paraburkholderia panacisoli]
MNSLVQTAALVVALALPIASFAQSNEPATHAQVQAQLAQLAQAGYDTAGDSTHDPAGIQVAEAGVDRQRDASAGYGGGADGASQSGAGMHPLYDVGLKSIYIKH